MTRVQEMQKFIDEILDKQNKEIAMAEIGVGRSTTYSYTKCIRVQDIYPGDLLGVDGRVRVPEGYEYVDFRPPKSGEWHIDMHRDVAQACGDFSSQSPRLIVRKKPIKKYWLVETTHTLDDPAEQFPPYVDTKISIRLPGSGMQAQFSAQPIELTDNPPVYGEPQGAKYFRTKVRGE